MVFAKKNRTKIRGKGRGHATHEMLWYGTKKFKFTRLERNFNCKFYKRNLEMADRSRSRSYHNFDRSFFGSRSRIDLMIENDNDKMIFFSEYTCILRHNNLK